VAALSAASVRRLVLVAPYGLFDAAVPTRDVFAVRPDARAAERAPSACAARCHRPARSPGGRSCSRAPHAAARLLWPLGERGPSRLHRVKADPTRVGVTRIASS
jgi:hypothetical protein